MKYLFLIFALTFSFIGGVSAGEVETNVAKLKSSNSCRKCNLVGAKDLFFTFFTEADLTEANLSRAKLTGADLSEVNFKGTNFFLQTSLEQTLPKQT